jgi:hypothetical protein
LIIDLNTILNHFFSLFYMHKKEEERERKGEERGEI